VVLVTAASGSDEKIEALSAGADDYITKPFYPKELLARVRTILRTQQLEKQLQRQSQQLSFLNHIGQELASVLETQDVLATAVSGAQQVLELETTSAYMLEGGVLRCREISGGNGRYPPSAYPPIRPNQGFIGDAFKKQSSAFLNDAPSDPRYDQQADAPPEQAVSSIIVSPMVVRGRRVGILVGYNARNGRFTEIDLDIFASLAISASESIENAWLFQRIRMRQSELLESRNTLQAIIDGIPHPIYTINNRWQLVAINKSKLDQINGSAGDLTGQTCYRAFYRQDAPCSHCRAAATLTRKEAQSWPVSWHGEDHLPRDWDVNAYPLPGSQTASAGAVILWQDRTEERRLENSLLQAGKLAAIGQLAAGVAHEINNPLTAINANAEMLKMVIPPEDDNYEAVDLIARAGERATKVVRGLLDFARQEQYKFTGGEVNPSIEQALDLVSYQLQTAGILVEKQFSSSLPAITASWEHLKSVWLNLIVNARDAVQSRPENRKISITTQTSEDNAIQVIIRDNGKGMTAAEAEHIFEPFYTTKDPGKGTGLGLATSHRIIEQHGGDINVISALNEGTTFIIRLPVTKADL
jgi:two-component system NtrC family sensor kinase